MGQQELNVPIETNRGYSGANSGQPLLTGPTRATMGPPGPNKANMGQSGPIVANQGKPKPIRANKDQFDCGQ